jgi:hypothetical protein
MEKSQAAERKMGLLSLWGPVAVKETREGCGAAQVDLAHGFGPRPSCLMRDIIGATGSRNIFLQRQSWPPLFAVPSLHPVKYYPQVAPMKALD